MNFDTRNNSALMKRAEQLRRWEESDTNREPITPKNERGRKIKFSLGCVFLAACIAGDKDEVVRLIESGADINTANVDGLTALHQACIDDNLEMVEFLVNHGADINRQDNEGWTPLHATASCGFVSIARYLIENGADLTAINSDGELAIDLASTNAMADYLQRVYDENGIDCDDARQSEEQIMLSDAKKWLRSDASEADKPHPKTGATALHVAAAKGYTKVLSLLLAGRANVDKQDNDGWAPLHAAAHWGQKESIQMLVDAMADIDIKNYAGQTAVDVAESSIVKFLEDIKANNKRIKRRPISQIRISDTIENHMEAPTKMIRVEVKADTKDENKSKPASENVTPISADGTVVDDDAPWRRSSSLRSRTQVESPPKPPVPDKDKSAESEVILRRTQSFENDEKFYQKYHELRARIKANSCPQLPATQQTGVLGAVNPPNNFSVQRSASLKDHKNLRKTTVSLPVSPSTPSTPPNTGQIRRSFVPPVRDEESETQRKAHAKRVRETRRSTQGVTLDEIKSAEELVKKKNLNNNNNNPNNEIQNTSVSTETTVAFTAPSVNTTINDRVPATSIDDDTLGIESKSTEQTASDEISATFTMTVPTSSTRTITENFPEGISDSASITYTIPPSQPPPLTALNRLTSPSISNADFELPNSDDGSRSKEEEDSQANQSDDRDRRNNMAEVSATVSLPIASNVTRKTEEDEVEEITKIASPAFDKTTSSLDRKSDSSPTDELSRREKRSLFDMDNASSLTLAEKLRNEANKYNEASHSNNDLTTVGLGSKSGTDENSDSVFGRKSDSMPSSPLHVGMAERRPSWRLKFDTGNKFKLEDASSGSSVASNNSTIITSAPAVIAAATAQRRQNTSNNSTTQPQRPVSAPVISTTPSNDNANDRVKDVSNEITVSLRRNRNTEDKENDKENDSRSAQATQAVIQRRRRPKRRSTGVVHLDVDDMDPDRQDSPAENDDKEMSFRSRSRATQPIPPTRRRSLSSSRVSSANNPSSQYANGNQSYGRSYTAGGSYYPSQNTYQSPYLANHYGSRENIYNHSPRSNGFYSNGTNYDKRYGGTNSYGTDRYVSPYSSFDNGVTTAGLSLGIAAKAYQSPYTKPISSSNTSLNSYQYSKPTKVSTGTNTPPVVVNRSSSLREQERKGRSRTRSRAAAARSASVSSEKSEGYESGSERLSRSRVDSASSLSGEQNDSKSTTENGEVIDYKALWEAVKAENEKLKQELNKKDDDLTTAKAAVERFTNATTKNSLSELEKRERRAMERKLSEMEEELKHLDVLKAENQRLKEENGALIRVISKLSK